MQKYILQRLVLSIPTILVVSFVTFSMVRVMPGDVVLAQLAESPTFRDEDVERIRSELGLDDPWLVQYGEWVVGALQGDLGNSLWSDREVTDLISDRLPITLQLTIMAFILANAFGLMVGIMSATQQNKPVDYILRFLSIGSLSIPSFWIATLVVVLGARYLGYLAPLVYVPFEEDPLTNLQQFIVPSLVLSLASAGAIARMVRSSTLEVLRADFVRTARSKGLPENRILSRHVLKNAMIPVITLQGFQLAYLLTGSVIVEIVFNLPGLGRLMLDAVTNRDYTLIQGISLFFSAIVIGLNLAVDVAYGWLDPRIKL